MKYLSIYPDEKCQYFGLLNKEEQRYSFYLTVIEATKKHTQFQWTQHSTLSQRKSIFCDIT